MAMREEGRGPFSSSAFRIVAAALALLVVIATAIAFVLFRQSEALLTSHVLGGLQSDAAVLALRSRAEGLDEVAQAVEQRMAVDLDRLYLLVDSSGTKRAGTLDHLPPEMQGKAGGGVFTYMRSTPGGGARNVGSSPRRAVAVMVGLNNGAHLLVGQDIETEQATLSRMRFFAFIGMAALALVGLAGGYAVSRVVLGRLEAVNRTAASIMAGDLSRRIPHSDAGDEIDAVAYNLNHMLDRIEQLMTGLREVSDNIAHDLKTPLNRLRNRAEAALREKDTQACRVGLEGTIEDADELIKTFNALLLIARLEAGALEGETEPVDIVQLVGDVAELYEPVAEEAGLTLVAPTPGHHIVQVNRHLVGQAVANLIDNAIKYGAVARPDAARVCSRCPDGIKSDRVATRVEVNVAVDRQEIEISVSDDGPGISEEDRARVLKRFVRLEQSRSRPGTGLGLSLVAAVARLHGGAFRLEDNAPGLRAVLALPVRPVATL